MKTSVIDVQDMLSVLSVLGVEKRIGEVPGVESVTVNFAAANATVRYDETRLNIADIKSDVRQSQYESAVPAAAPKGDGHAVHTAPGAPRAAPVPATPPQPVPDAAAAAQAPTTPPAHSEPPAAPPTGPVIAGDSQPDKATPNKN